MATVKGHWGKTTKERERLRTGREDVPLTDLTPWKDNPRVHEDDVLMLAELIEEHGFAGAIVATPDGVIRAGHARYAACQHLGLKTIPVHWKNFPSEDAAAAYAMGDNRASEWAEWDHEKLARLFSKRASLSKLGTGFQQKEIDWLTGKTKPGEPKARPSIAKGETILLIGPADKRTDLVDIFYDYTAGRIKCKLLRRDEVEKKIGPDAAGKLLGGTTPKRVAHRRKAGAK